MLDLESVRLFTLAVEFGNLTRAATAAGTVQPVVSQRLKTLEARLGRRLLERTPRFVRPTTDGLAFLPRARALLASHDAALHFRDEPAIRFGLGTSDHALGIGLEPVLKSLRAALPAGAVISVEVGLSQHLRDRFDAGRLYAAIIRREAGSSDGEVLGHDPLGWRTAADWAPVDGQPMPLATLGPPCGVHAVASRRLEQARIPWREAFRAGSCGALAAGVRAGLGVAAMGQSASDGLPDHGPELGLPTLPASEIVMFARSGSPVLAAALRVLATAIRARLR